METTTQISPGMPTVVIIGGGFGGLYAAKALANQPVQVTLIDRTNHHLFQPLLYQVATAGLSPGEIAQPIRHILKEAQNISVIMGVVEGVDGRANVVRTKAKEYPYDFLIIAAGARHSLPGVAPVAMQMGTHAAQNILALVQGKPSRRFKYLNKGNMATIGRNRAVADLNGIRFGGFAAWLSWLLVHLIFLVGLRNRIQVSIQWVWAYFTYARGARLIYGPFQPAVRPSGQRPTSEEVSR